MKTMWTALISAIVALLAMLGFAAPANAATAPAAPADNSTDAQQQATATAARHSARTERPAAQVPLSARWSARLAARSVPPTMKQRIRAEAHGGSPSVRQVPSLDRARGVRADYETAA